MMVEPEGSYSDSRRAVVINDAVFVAAGAAGTNEQGLAVSALCDRTQLVKFSSE